MLHLRQNTPHPLHGILDVRVFEIDNLSLQCGLDLCIKKGCLDQVKKLVTCSPKVVGSNIYVVMSLGNDEVGRTKMVQRETSRPNWNESVRIYCAHEATDVVFTIKCDKPSRSSLIGRAYVPVEDFVKGNAVDTWVNIVDEEDNPVYGHSKLHVKIQFFGASKDSNWSKGINLLNFEGVPYTFFRQRQYCNVALYQDAHNTHYFKRLTSMSGKKIQPHGCWEDIFDAINDAKHLIYITGWSVHTELRLIRRASDEDTGAYVLGELLKKKANEGVIVLMLVWDDRPLKELRSDSSIPIHGEETHNYFRNTRVHCVMCPRNLDGGQTTTQAPDRVSRTFSHHQKAIVVDAQLSDEELKKRRIVSFLGGLDLCEGRYDRQDHPLFETLNTDHKDDFYQPNFLASSIRKGGPREPWHDIHCRLEGPIAWDVLYNFEQRWKRQVGNHSLIPIDKLAEIVVHPLATASANDPETWTVQLFRSIDGAAAANFPKSQEAAAALGLMAGKDCFIDRSIQDAYINAIRRAKNFIYIESEYFIGSSFSWERSNDDAVDAIGASNLIPKELCLKILQKIGYEERFAVYVVIPMWPEGIPESKYVQSVLHWQRRTMEMMYSHISQALYRKGAIDVNARDYLTFFCLGTREAKKVEEFRPEESPEIDSNYYRAQQARRFMIYVHSNTMIVDDEYIIVGSASINQRSMDGARDTEIAMGAFQPNQLTMTNPARGRIYDFRMDLWYEHLGIIDEAFNSPESLNCIRTVNRYAERNWTLFTQSTCDEDMRAHLLRYPIEVDREGGIHPLEGFEHFPDTNAPVLGTKSNYPPPIQTT